ncbi:hypothetical protein [Dactylosporangium sp. CS-033363]|uniref:hypothetical protein n=1 Tax=Dactylosporangium sp. CS-033363 TaxID=3239935 RepID=UPI003D9489E0
MLVLVLDEHEYLRQVELLAGDVVRAAAEEGWLTHGADAAEAPLCTVRSTNLPAR